MNISVLLVLSRHYSYSIFGTMVGSKSGGRASRDRSTGSAVSSHVQYWMVCVLRAGVTTDWLLGAPTMRQPPDDDMTFLFAFTFSSLFISWWKIVYSLFSSAKSINVSQSAFTLAFVQRRRSINVCASVALSRRQCKGK